MDASMKAGVRPLVSIITVSYNGGNTIRKTIESVLCQTYTNMEYHIVDGLSTDHTVAIAHEYDARFAAKGIGYTITSEADRGIYDAMNKGIRAASGVLVGMVNSDDWYEPDAVETAVRAYRKWGYDMFYADIRLVRRDGRAMVKHSRLDRFPTSRHWNHPTTFITKKAYLEMGGYKNIGIHDDFDLFLRFHRAGRKMVAANKILANFRVGGVSNARSLKKCRQRCRDRYRCYRDNGYSPLSIIECIVVEAVKYLLA